MKKQLMVLTWLACGACFGNNGQISFPVVTDNAQPPDEDEPLPDDTDTDEGSDEGDDDPEDTDVPEPDDTDPPDDTEWCELADAESFQQGGGQGADMLFFLDRSASMADDVQNLRANLPDLIDGLAGVPGQHQLLFVVEEDGCGTGGVLDAGAPNITDTLEDILQVPTSGVSSPVNEAGLGQAIRALGQTGPGQCNEGFLREDSQRIFFFMSDEPDQSVQPWPLALSSLRTLAEPIEVYGVVGPEQVTVAGCWADFGEGYTEIAEATGGAVHDICQPAWPFVIDDLVEAAYGTRDSFELNRRVKRVDLVRINGVIVLNWTLAADGKTLLFDTDPPINATIDVDYTYDEPC